MRLGLAALAPLVVLVFLFTIALGRSAWRARWQHRQLVRASGEQTDQSINQSTNQSINQPLLEIPEAADAGPSEDAEPSELQEATRPTYPSIASENKGAPSACSRRTTFLREVLSGAVLLVLPITLWGVFLLLPSITRIVFGAFDCEPFEYNDRDSTFW